MRFWIHIQFSYNCGIYSFSSLSIVQVRLTMKSMYFHCPYNLSINEWYKRYRPASIQLKRDRYSNRANITKHVSHRTLQLILAYTQTYLPRSLKHVPDNWQDYSRIVPISVIKWSSNQVIKQVIKCDQVRTSSYTSTLVRAHCHPSRQNRHASSASSSHALHRRCRV